MSEGLWLELRTRQGRLRAGEEQGELRVLGGRPLTLVAGGLAPGTPVRLSIGEETLETVSDQEGRAEWFERRALSATAGRVLLRAETGDQERSLGLIVEPTRFAVDALRRLLEDLRQIDAGLAGDLGGRGLVEGGEGTPEAALAALEGVVGQLTEAAIWIRRRPFGRAREDVRAVGALAPRLGARDLRWLARHPAARSRTAGQQVAVRRERWLDLDVVENRGTLWLFGEVDARLDAVDARLDAERRRLEGGRAAREAFLTGEGNLFDSEDRPRLRAVRRRVARVECMRRDLEAARLRAGLPLTVRRASLRRTARMEGHPGYWRVLWAGRRLRALQLAEPAPTMLPAANLDRLYERWVVLRIASALCGRLGLDLAASLRLDTEGWFTRLPQGELVAGAIGDRTLHLHYEPRYAWQGDGALVKLHPGGAWCPDVVLEVRAAGQPIALHVFDAKHQLGPQGGPPWEALRAIWFKYVESIGFAESGLPAVASAWIVYPGATGGVRSLGPRMLGPSWPPDRARGGAVALCPGGPEDGLSRVLTTILPSPRPR